MGSVVEYMQKLYVAQQQRGHRMNHTHIQAHKKQSREVILMIYILLGFTFPQYFQHFQFETQSEKKRTKQNNNHTYIFNLIWKPHIHTVHPLE